MTRPPPEVIMIIDQAVARFDATLVEQGDGRPTTSSYAVIVRAWDRFKFLVEAIDVAVVDPLAPGAAVVLRTARTLVATETYALAFWLSHVGEALLRGTDIQPG